MKFLVSGADQDTGKEKTATVEAASEDEAMNMARKWGWFVSDVRPMSPLDYRPPTAATASAAIPDYAGIKAGAGAIKLFGLLLIVVGLIAAAVIVNMFMNKEQSIEAFSLGISSIAMLAAGIFLRLIGALALAHRDLVRNSFRVS